jgi:xanthosine utilization system XapX-like protein
MQITTFITFGLLLLSTVGADSFVDENYDGVQQRLPPIIIMKMIMGMGPKIDRHVKRIIGGKDINIGNFKHQVSLRKNGVHICGASIIGEL